MAEKYPAFKEARFNEFIRNKENNGFLSSVIKMGRNNFINELSFLKWVKEQNPHCVDLVTDEDELNKLGKAYKGKYCEHCRRACGC